MVHNALKYGMLKFTNKQKPQVESELDPSKVKGNPFVDPIDAMIVDVVWGIDTKVDEVTILIYIK